MDLSGFVFETLFLRLSFILCICSSTTTSVLMDLEKSSSGMVFEHQIRSNDLMGRFYLSNNGEPHQIIPPIYQLGYHHKLQLQANKWTIIFTCMVDVQNLKHNLVHFSLEYLFFVPSCCFSWYSKVTWCSFYK